MLVIRLTKVGRRHDPAFRLVVTESKRATRSGKYHELLGNYDAHSGVSQIKQDRVSHWLERGAKVSSSAFHLLKRGKFPVARGAIRS